MIRFLLTGKNGCDDLILAGREEGEWRKQSFTGYALICVLRNQSLSGYAKM